MEAQFKVCQGHRLIVAVGCTPGRVGNRVPAARPGPGLPLVPPQGRLLV